MSLQQMVLFGQNPSQGTLFKASQFLAEELPVRLAHRMKELDELPHNLSDMPSIKKVKNWYAQSFEVGLELSSPTTRLNSSHHSAGTHQLPAHPPSSQHPASTHELQERRIPSPS